MNRTGRAFTAARLRTPARRAPGPIITPADGFFFRASCGRWKLSAPIIPSLMVFRTGARSGLRRETPLMRFPQPDGSWLIGGSNFGLGKHPAWSASVIANPEAEVHYRRVLSPASAGGARRPESGS